MEKILIVRCLLQSNVHGKNVIVFNLFLIIYISFILYTKMLKYQGVKNFS